MPGIPTEILAEQIEASNLRLTRAIEELTRKVEEGQKEFIAFRLDLADKLSAIRTSMGWVKGIAAMIVIPLALAIAAYSYKATDRAARLEESIVQLRDHAKDQDSRIGKLLELRDERERPRSAPVPHGPSHPAPKAGTSASERPSAMAPSSLSPTSRRLVRVAFAPEKAATPDSLKALQTDYAEHARKKQARAYHFGSQGPKDVFSNHMSHSNRLVPVYLFGRKANLKAVTGENSRYRDASKIQEIYGFLPENTVNPRANYADQSDLYRVQKEAIERGVKHLFIVWFDGLDWPTTQAAAIVKTGKVYTEGMGAGLIFQDYRIDGMPPQYGYVVTSPTHDRNTPDVDHQTVVIPSASLGGGYDAEIAGPNPWTLGPLGATAPGYFKGSSPNDQDREGVKRAGRVLHAYTDSSQSAAEMISGVKAYNNGLNVTDDGRLVTTLFHDLQGKGWKVGTVTSVPFDHASPAAMYARNVNRNDYQDLAREMLGLPGIMQKARKAELYPGLDVVMGAGYGIRSDNERKGQGENYVPGNMFIADPDLKRIDVKNGGKYVVIHTQRGVNGGKALKQAATEAAGKSARLFGLFGRDEMNHLPFRTADGRYDPAPNAGRHGQPGSTEEYTKADRVEQPTLAQMTDAALTVLAHDPEQSFALFIEAGDVDFALHANNLDNAVGAVYSGEDAIKEVIQWVEKYSNWDDSMLLVSADHGHYLVVDDAKALSRAGGGVRP